jgi:hypothetical protein
MQATDVDSVVELNFDSLSLELRKIELDSAVDFDLNSLPLELQEMIISQDCDVLRMFFQVNKTYKYLLEKEYLKQLGGRGVYDNEWESVYILQPFSAILYVKQEYHSPPEYLVRMRHNHLYTEATLMELVYTIEGVSFNFVNENHDDVVKDYEENCHILASDTLTYYNVNKNRLSCMAIDPYYANRKCLNDLYQEFDKYLAMQIEYDRYKHDYGGVKDERFEEDLRNTIIYTYLRLLIDKLAFNIMDGFNVNKLEDIDNNLEDIIRDIQNLFNIILYKVENM